MRRNQSSFEPSHAGDRQRPSRGRASVDVDDDDDRDEHRGVPDEDDDAYEDDDDRVGQARIIDDDEPDERGRVERVGAVREDDGDDDDGDQRVAHRPNPLPAREEDEEEIAEADIMESLDEALDMEVLDTDDRRRLQGSDA